MKDDGNKARHELIPPEILDQLSRVLTFGAQKYADESWRDVEAPRYYAALQRHLGAMRFGERLDPESGLMHAAHVLANAAFLLSKEAENQETLSVLTYLPSIPQKIERRELVRERALSDLRQTLGLKSRLGAPKRASDQPTFAQAIRETEDPGASTERPLDSTQPPEPKG